MGDRDDAGGNVVADAGLHSDRSAGSGDHDFAPGSDVVPFGDRRVDAHCRILASGLQKRSVPETGVDFESFALAGDQEERVVLSPVIIVAVDAGEGFGKLVRSEPDATVRGMTSGLA